MKTQNLSKSFQIIILLVFSGITAHSQNRSGLGASIDVESVKASYVQGPEIPFGFAYVVKFVCGSHSSRTPSVDVLPGDYATQINVVNLAREVEFYKKIFVLKGKQQPTKPLILPPERLDHNQAMSFTCTDIANHLNMPLPPPFFEGLVEIVTRNFITVPGKVEGVDPLDVWSVYTYRDIE